MGERTQERCGKCAVEIDADRGVDFTPKNGASVCESCFVNGTQTALRHEESSIGETLTRWSIMETRVSRINICDAVNPSYGIDDLLKCRRGAEDHRNHVSVIAPQGVPHRSRRRYCQRAWFG